MDNESQRSYEHRYKIPRRTKERVMDLLDFVPYPIVVQELDGTVNYVNDAFTDLFGWTLDELAGNQIPYVPPNLVEDAGQVIKGPHREKFVRRLETRRLTKDGRVLDIQQQVEDIMQARPHRNQGLLSLLLAECSDQLEALVADETGDTSAADRIRNRIQELYGVKEDTIAEIDLAGCVRVRIHVLKPRFAHREVEIIADLDAATPGIQIPADVIQKIIDGLIRNAIENTPDEGRVVISVRRKSNGVKLAVHDYGIGITANSQHHIFEGFLVARDTAAYSSLRPFDFKAGGKGADLLRMKIFSERYNFKINMTSSRCQFIPAESDTCPGKISRCPFCNDKQDCFQSGATVFTLFFPFKKATPYSDCGCVTRWAVVASLN